jgi:ABC-type Mn2+/Zn2+ transport system ATPase subunit
MAAAVVVVDMHDASLTAGMSALVMMVAAVDTRDGSVDTVVNEVENEFRFQHPFTANITGPTGCGKTYFVKTLLQNCRRESSGCTRDGKLSATSSERPCSHE